MTLARDVSVVSAAFDRRAALSRARDRAAIARYRAVEAEARARARSFAHENPDPSSRPSHPDGATMPSAVGESHRVLELDLPAVHIRRSPAVDLGGPRHPIERYNGRIEPRRRIRLT